MLLLSLSLLALAAPLDLTALLAGLAGVGITYLGGQLTRKVAGADAKITGAYKSFQPIIAGALGLALPAVCQSVGLLDACPSGDQLASSPLGTLVGITLIEATRRARGRK